jgi:hypothetical protein
MVSDRTLAERLNLPRGVVVNYCRCGRYLGAFLHPQTRLWWIPLPLKLVWIPLRG